MLSHDKLENYRNKALEMYTKNGGVKYSFAHFAGEYSELTYYMVSHVLSEYDLDFLNHAVMTLLRESISNAVKANLKRVYFEKTNADINDQEIYNNLINDFKAEYVSKVEEHVDALKNKDYSVTLLINKKNNHLVFAVQNNVVMNSDELERVNARIKAAGAIENMAEAFDKFEDEQEGAGLGLIISMMMLKKTGIGIDSFKIETVENNTIASLSVPMQLKRSEEVNKIYDKIRKELDNIPSFPDSINQVIKLCDDPDSDTGRISSLIEKDPALTTSIVRMANSNSFSLGKKITGIKQAMTIIGIKNVRDLALAISSREILNEQYKVLGDVWKHSEKCAGYSRLIAKETQLPKLADSVYLGGLLHDLGKIILLAINEKIYKSIESKTTNAASVEEITLGLSHAVVGAELATHWNFPDEIVDIIRHHHSVFAGNEKNIQQISIVHLADAFIQKEDKKQGFIYIDETAKSRLGLKTQNELDALHQKIKNLYALDND